MADIGKLGAVEILDLDERIVRVGDLWRDGTIVLAFVRHFG